MIPKYRAYSKADKAIYEVLLIDFKAPIEQIKVRKTGISDWFDWCDIVLMQSTGLFDKHGVEIFEGDVVKFQDELYQIEFRSYRFEAKGFWLTYQDVPDDFFSEDAYKKCEVVGNVHENQKLLEVVE